MTDIHPNLHGEEVLADATLPESLCPKCDQRRKWEKVREVENGFVKRCTTCGHEMTILQSSSAKPANETNAVNSQILIVLSCPICKQPRDWEVLHKNEHEVFQKCKACDNEFSMQNSPPLLATEPHQETRRIELLCPICKQERDWEVIHKTEGRVVQKCKTCGTDAALQSPSAKNADESKASQAVTPPNVANPSEKKESCINPAQLSGNKA